MIVRDIQLKRKPRLMKLVPAALLLTLACAAPPPATAATFLVSYSGFVTAADEDNVFGLTAKELVGQAIRADVDYTTTVPGTRMTTASSDEVTGGVAFSDAPVISSVLFSVQDRSFSFSPTYYSDVFISPTFADAYGYDTDGDSFQTYISPDQAAPTNLETLFNGSGKGDSGGPLSQYSFVGNLGSVVDFDSTHIAVSAAPEPSTWLLMTLGVGALGLALRRRSGLATTTSGGPSVATAASSA